MTLEGEALSKTVLNKVWGNKVSLPFLIFAAVSVCIYEHFLLIAIIVYLSEILMNCPTKILSIHSCILFLTREKSLTYDWHKTVMWWATKHLLNTSVEVNIEVWSHIHQITYASMFILIGSSWVKWKLVFLEFCIDLLIHLEIRILNIHF